MANTRASLNNSIAYSYLSRALKMKRIELLRSPDFNEQRAAWRALDKVIDGRNIDDIDAWVDKYLSDAARKTLLKVVSNKKTKKKYHSIVTELSRDAHLQLTMFAEKYELTLSEAVLKLTKSANSKKHHP